MSFIASFYYLNVALCTVVFVAFRLFITYVPAPGDWSSTLVRPSYDYIIVGSGTAGSYVACGLTGQDVLILEAGASQPWFMDVPVLQPLYLGTRYDWQYETVPQDHACRAMNGNRSRWVAGKIVGGSHMLSNLVNYNAGRHDFQHWFSDGHSLDRFMEFFERRYAGNAKTPVEASYQTTFGQAFLEATEGLESERGHFSRASVTTRYGRRWATKDGCQLSVDQTLAVNSVVERLILEGDVAKGVVFRKNGELVTVHANKGVILSAGTIGSAKILLQSGIGPSEDLEELAITPIKHLPVGKNLQDHIGVGMDLLLLKSALGVKPIDVFSVKSAIQFLQQDITGSVISLAGCEAVGYLSLGSNYTSDVQFMVLPVGVTTDGGVHLRNVLNLRENVWDEYFQPLLRQWWQTPVTIMPILLHPESRGEVRLQSSDPSAMPLINPRYLESDADVRALIRGIRMLRHIVEQPAMQRLNAEINPKSFPGCEGIRFDSDAYWECYIRSFTNTIFHPVGTCRMGDDPATSVVSNSDFSVHGIDRLFVVDASIMPTLPSGNPNAVVMALADHFLKRFLK